MAEKPTYEELERRVQELEKAESELILAEDRLKKIFNNTHDAIFIHDQEGKILDVNNKMCRMYKLTKEEALKVNIEDVSSSKMSRETLLEKWQKVLNGENLLFEWEALRPKDKSIFNVEVSIQKISFPDRDIVLANVRDITKRKRAEEALRVREEKYRLLFNMGVNAMFLVDNNTTQILECNNKASQLLGYSAQELLSLKMTDLSTTPEATRRACQEKVLKKERVYKKKDGSLISVDITSEHFYLDKRAVHISAMRDITAKKHTEEALQKSEERLKLALDSVSDAVWDWRVDTGEVYFSSRWYTMLGYKPYELPQVFETWRQLLHPDDLPSAEAEVFQHLEMAEPFEIEFRMRTKKNHWRWILARGKTVEKDDQGDAVRMLGTHMDITERKKTEKALKDSEERFHLAMDASRDGVYEWDLETREIYYSPGWKRMLGFKPDELPDDFSVWEKLTRPEDVEKSWQIMKEVVAGKRERFEMEFQMRHKDGHWVHILSRSKLYKDAKGKPVRVIGTHVDISENIQQRERLKLSESRYRKAQELGKVGNWEYDLKTQEFWGSDEAKRIYGFDPAKDRFNIEEVESHVLERERVHQAMLDLIEKEKPYNLEFDIITKDTGKRKTVISIGELEKDASGNPVKISGVFQDITHRKQAENALESERRFLTAVFDNIEEAIVICDEKGKLIRFNKAAQTLHGLPERPIMPDQWAEYYNLFKTDCTTPLPVEEIPLYRALKGEHVRNAEIVVVPLNSSPRFMVCNGQALSDHNDKTIGAVVAMHDDTERRMSEKEREKLQGRLHEVQKMESIGRLAGGVAHDFNNMLGVILGHTELALLQADENHELYDDLKEIQKAAKRSADITKQLLAFARKQTISPRKLDLNDTVESMLNMLRRLIGENIDLMWQPAANLWPVKVDPSQIDQILANLCVNARDAITGVGKLTIETGIKSFDEQYCKEHSGFIPGDFVLLAVTDNGCGMDKDTLDNLFEPFFTTKEVGKGTGLGLATIYGIVKQNNGFINVYSEPGKGSTFKIYLPRLVAVEDAEKAIPEKKPAAGGTETILLVEDEPTILRMTRIMLEKNGYSVLPADTPAEAVEKAKNHYDSIDLLMTDVVMPEMNGRDLAEKLIELHPNIKLLFMSGYTADVIAHQGVLDDGVAFIQKPFSMADMMEKVREVLDMSPEKIRND